MKYTKLEPISMKGHPELTEPWVQSIIADDPAVLGLGDVILRDKERIQKGTGRLDILLQDSDTNKRYEVEIQLGAVNESHIIRTIEYWDIERKRYPQYDHCAVIVAEDITSRFLNVLSLFNGSIPLIAIQMTAIKTDSGVGLNFTKVLDEMDLGLVDEDEAVNEPADRSYWETKRSNKKIVSIADEVIDLLREVEPSLELKYNKHYIGLASSGVANNFVLCRPKKAFMRLEIKAPKSEEYIAQIEDSGLNLMDYSRWGAYRLNLRKGDVAKHRELLKSMVVSAYEARG